MAARGLEPRRVTERARKVDVAPSRQLARVMDDAVVVPVLAGLAVTVLGIWLLWRWLTCSRTPISPAVGCRLMFSALSFRLHGRAMLGLWRSW